MHIDQLYALNFTCCNEWNKKHRVSYKFTAKDIFVSVKRLVEIASCIYRPHLKFHPILVVLNVIWDGILQLFRPARSLLFRTTVCHIVTKIYELCRKKNLLLLKIVRVLALRLVFVWNFRTRPTKEYVIINCVSFLGRCGRLKLKNSYFHLNKHFLF